MKKALALLTLLFAAGILTGIGEGPGEVVWPDANRRLDLDGDGISDCWDQNGDKKCEVSGMWDADGDGSGYTTCTAKDAPLPECIYAGQEIWADWMDDTNCMIPDMFGDPKCGNDYTMDWGGTIQLDDGKTYVMFACWDVPSWLADAGVIGGGLPTEAALNDPRNALAINEEGSTRHNDYLTDGAWNDCPEDEFGYKLTEVAAGYWQGTIRGAGRPTRRLNELSASNPVKGTYLVDDRGRFTDTWFDGGGARGISTGNWAFAINACKNPSTSSCGGGDFGAYATNSNRGGKGWGQLTEAIDWMDTDPILCVCDSDGDDCAVVPGTAVAAKASADGWIATLSDGDTLLVDWDASSVETRGVMAQVHIDGDPSTFVQGSCSDSKSKEVPIGWTNTIHANMDQSIGWHKNTTSCASTNSQCAAFALPPEHYGSGLTIENLTWTPMDTPNRTGDDCSDTSIPYGPNTGSDNVDQDCDGKGFLKTGSGGFVRFRDSTVLDWGSYNTDGSVAPEKMTIDNNLYDHGWGTALIDPNSFAQVRNIVVSNSVMSTAIFGAFGVQLDLEGVLLDNVATSGTSLVKSDHVRGLRIVNLRAQSSASAGQPFYFGCGIENMVFQDVFITGRVGRGVSPSADMIALAGQGCTSDDPVRANFFSNFGEDAPGVTSRLVYIAANKPTEVYGNIFQGARFFREYGGANQEACLYAFAQRAKTFADGDVDTGNDEIHEASHGFNDEEGPIRLTNSGGALPAGLAVDTDYYIVTSGLTNSPATDYYGLSLTAGGAKVDITAAAGGGTHTTQPPMYGATENTFLGGFTPDETGDAPFCYLSSTNAIAMPSGQVANGVGMMRNGTLWRTTPLVGSATTNGIAAWVDAATSCYQACKDLGPQMICDGVVAGANSDCQDTGAISVCGCTRAP